LDHSCATIYQLSSDISDAVGPLWGRTVKIFAAQLQKKLRDYIPSSVRPIAESGTSSSTQPVDSTATTCWPSLGRLLLLRQAGHVFAVTDYRHSVMGPVTMFLCQCLAQCPVVTVADVASGLLCVSILLDFSKGSPKIIPECFTFLRSVIQLFSITGADNDTITSHSGDVFQDLQQYETAMDSVRNVLAQRCPGSYRMQTTFDPLALRELREAAASAETEADTKVPWAAFDRKLNLDSVEPKHAVCLLTSVYTLIRRLFEHVGSISNITDGLPELTDPIVGSLQGLRPQSEPALPLSIRQLHASLVESATNKNVQIRKTRLPLQWRRPKVFCIESKNPRFQVDYKLKKDADPDSERVKLKQLNRDKKRQSKAAMRELRRDSNMLEQERFKEKRESLDAQRAERYKNFAWMEDQQATINEQVRKGKSLLKGGGSGIHKKARVKR
jgi:hypothetical protein